MFKKLLATSTATNSVELQNTTITFAPSIGVSSVWNVNCASGISFTENFSISSAASDYQLSVYNQANAGTLIIISAQTLSVSDGKLNLNSVTSGGNSTISGTAVTLRNSSKRSIFLTAIASLELKLLIRRYSQSRWTLVYFVSGFVFWCWYFRLELCVACQRLCFALNSHRSHNQSRCKQHFGGHRKF